MRHLAPLVLLPLALLSCGPRKSPAMVAEAEPAASVCGLQPDGSRRFQVLHLNDVYRIEGLADGRGGLARVRTLREELEEGCAEAVLLTHAGDALFPSMLSREFDGAQMIDVLNHLDGDGQAVDPRMVAVFGNHEFDKDDLEDAPLLQARVSESQFTWLDTNITWATGPDGATPLVGGDNVRMGQLLDLGGVKVGVFGLTIDNKVPAYVRHIDTDYVGIARTRVADLREQGAEVVIALTHLDAGDDASLIRELGDAGPDLVLGGHDHVLQSTVVAGRPVLKGDADAVRVRTVAVSVAADGSVGWTADEAGVRLSPETYPPDPAVLARVQTHLDAFEQAFCGEDMGCLTEPLTTATTDLIAEETRIRRYETNLGDWIVTRMHMAFPEADVAVVNSGALRLNQDISQGTPITRQIVEELFAYPARMHAVEIPGSTLREVLERSVSDWTGQGHWLQVAGVVFRHDPATESVSDIHIMGEDGPVPLDPDRTYTLVTLRYLLDPDMGDQDGYTMLSLSDEVPAPSSGQDLKQTVLDALAELGDAGLGPARLGRICNAQEQGAPCILRDR